MAVEPVMAVLDAEPSVHVMNVAPVGLSRPSVPVIDGALVEPDVYVMDFALTDEAYCARLRRL
jgi:hypothetical protein